MPFHASCKVDWEVAGQCADVKTKITDQIKALNGPAGCANGGEKCLYSLVSDSGMKVTATHETPKKHYKDDLTFSFTQSSNVCKVHGFSTSETWYAVLDHSTNYCNLRNLITGSGLQSTANFKETTSDSVCTQYSSADCSKY
ncbi:hypothetical protein LOTGIDRAFT_127112 [Lottia gigantea]|uniref:Uncharacterized protein n=1 Tax=Lottia gigantea TaxID=225164 RepID=V4BH48_LOTGI|nr:hypothetical protein LOTGIDRAFT_127112 [Lottia gigantea]ESO87849.1 hypothetical protein LOTGIDRAFT_127112 [Lottia gigantea]